MQHETPEHREPRMGGSFSGSDFRQWYIEKSEKG